MSKITIIKGVEGMAVYLNDFRIAGPKPWGGGAVVQEWTVREEDLDSAMTRPRVNDAPPKQPICCGGLGCPSCFSEKQEGVS